MPSEKALKSFQKTCEDIIWMTTSCMHASLITMEKHVLWLRGKSSPNFFQQNLQRYAIRLVSGLQLSVASQSKELNFWARMMEFS